MKLLPKGYPFGKGGYTNVTKTLADKAIDDFSTLKNYSKFPSLTIDERHILILALKKLASAREAFKKGSNKNDYIKHGHHKKRSDG